MTNYDDATVALAKAIFRAEVAGAENKYAWDESLMSVYGPHAQEVMIGLRLLAFDLVSLTKSVYENHGG